MIPVMYAWPTCVLLSLVVQENGRWVSRYVTLGHAIVDSSTVHGIAELRNCNVHHFFLLLPHVCWKTNQPKKPPPVSQRRFTQARSIDRRCILEPRVRAWGQRTKRGIGISTCTEVLISVNAAGRGAGSGPNCSPKNPETPKGNGTQPWASALSPGCHLVCLSHQEGAECPS
ncbi:hypothetical protein LY76DRAFT_46758 [Colletotrichum caudatum]|nr:hypothetical protein LY76DRAFT_46758 [Colletotrichum caudatum]